ncbi:hypothetical protein LCGC14_1334100, partial [marine sediment metagenome]
MTDTYQDPFTDERLEELLAQIAKLNYPEEYTWLDQDPEVAWESDPEDSGIAKQAVILQDADWEGCYHSSGAHLHFNVKVGGLGSWRGFLDTLHAAGLPDAANTRIDARADQMHNFELEIWWQDELNDFVRYALE